ncbi:Fic family protein [Noviherbaspirillum sedimenti]|uniref:Type II toxin-antitoxin system death-on-curing family toxin n=1 Tax=Noviherbaspirillum sedimenti TaxID=2320865 RepID=A0A3A3G3R9_9BURK|nr:Fic family protein [Noviherbaspirillum sedimenti]RJG01132.1 type II toxin-antitoxin system death-on-curing family toxin [Noviherbaspirillum sedimenti]
MNCHSIDPAVLVLLHHEALKAYGGTAGVRDGQMLDAALCWPMLMAAERDMDGMDGMDGMGGTAGAQASGEMDVADLAACYATGILRHAPFNDGNERAALLAMGLFLYVNGWQLGAAPLDAAQMIQAAAAGALDEARLAQWIRLNL